MVIDELTGQTVELLQTMIRNECVNDGTVESGHESRNADALEAVIGALYLGNGMAGVLAYIDFAFGDALDGVAHGKQGRDCKTLLQEAAQSRLKASPRYRVVAESGPEHEKVFEIEVSINGEIFGRSTGRSKKEAEQAAAEKTLALLEVRA